MEAELVSNGSSAQRSTRRKRISWVAGRTGLALASGLLLVPQTGLADGRDFSLDFTAAAPDSYDHRFGGGAYNDRTIGADVQESLEGKNFACGELVTYLTAISVDDQTTDPEQAIEIDFSFLADTTGRPGAAIADVANVQVNYGPVENGAGPGGTDAGIQDDAGSTAFLVQETLTGPLFTSGSELVGTVRVDDLEAGEQVVLRVDARIVCQPGTSPTGNLHAQLSDARVVDPALDAISGGAQTISVKKVGELLFPVLALQKTVTTADGSCPGQEILRVASGDDVKYCYEIANFGTQALTNLTAIDDNATPGIPDDDFGLSWTRLSDEDSDGVLDDLAPLAIAVAESSRWVDHPLRAELVNRISAGGDDVPSVWDVATVLVTELPAGSCSVAVTASLDGTCPGTEVVNVLEGSDVTWCYQVSNSTNYDLFDIAIADAEIGDVGFLESVEPGGSADASHTQPEFVDAVSTASASATDPFGNLRDCTPDDAAVNVVRPGVNIDKTASESGACPGHDSLAVIAGSEIVYCYQISNSGDTHVYGLGIDDDKLGYIGGVIELAVGETRMLASAPVEIPDDVTNVAAVSGADQFGFPVFDQDAAIVDALAADLAILKTGTQGVNREESDQVDYVLTVTNNGDLAAEDVVVTDDLPADFLFQSVTPSDACTLQGTQITCSLGTLQPGESTIIEIHGTVEMFFGRLDNVACTETTTPEIELDDNCDQLVTKVAPGDTRSAGFYGNHPDVVQLCLEASGGVIDLGYVAIADEDFDDQIDATVGPDLDCEVETGLELAMGVLNAGMSRLNDGTQRTPLEHARTAAARQVLVAWCNTTLLGTEGGLDFDAIRAILAGDDIGAMQAIQDLANTFNLSGDLLPLSVPAGPSDSSFPWDDPTDPYDPGDATDCPDTDLPEPGQLILLGAGLAFLLTLSRRRMKA